VETLNSSGTATARFTQGLGIDEPLEVYEGHASYYYSADGLGSVVALTKSKGAPVFSSERPADAGVLPGGAGLWSVFFPGGGRKVPSARRDQPRRGTFINSLAPLLSTSSIHRICKPAWHHTCLRR
jgi:hypothetical protein